MRRDRWLVLSDCAARSFDEPGERAIVVGKALGRLRYICELAQVPKLCETVHF
jgi:hypothetical protein